jgi:cytidine deaminase
LGLVPGTNNLYEAVYRVIEKEMYRRAIEFIKKRYPHGKGNVAVMHTADGQYLLSVAIETIDSNVELCAETGALCEAAKYDLKITHSLCVVRENENSPCQILTPCGICQERLRYYGTDVLCGVTTEDNVLKFVSLSQLQPYHWTTAFDDIVMYDDEHTV